MPSKRYKYSRYGIYYKIEEYLKTMNLKKGKCLLIGDSLNDKTGKINNTALIDMLPKGCDIIAPGYPEVDIHDMPYADNEFDYVLSDQILEHVEKPWIAIDEVHRVLKTDGLAIFTSCLIHGIHGVPNDYWRFTPNGLRVLFERFSHIHQADGIGNLLFVIKCLSGQRGIRVLPGTDMEKETLANDGINLFTVWIIAEK